MNPSQYKTASKLVQLGNVIIWLRNQKMLSMDITSSQADVMRYILKNPDRDISAGDIMEELWLSQSTMAGIIKRLELKGLIERNTDYKDARKSIITPTEDGMRLKEYLQEIAYHTEQILLKGLSENEQAEFNRMLQVALNNLNEVRH